MILPTVPTSDRAAGRRWKLIVAEGPGCRSTTRAFRPVRVTTPAWSRARCSPLSKNAFHPSAGRPLNNSTPTGAPLAKKTARGLKSVGLATPLDQAQLAPEGPPD